jgi:hypothetical protein
LPEADDQVENSFNAPGLSASEKRTDVKDENHFRKLKMIYPVGRHLGLRSLGSNLMRFLRLPSDIKNITSLTFSP